MLKIAVAALLLSLPVAAEEWAPPTPAEWAFVGAAAGLSLMDVLQTSGCLYRGLCAENNPLLGHHPNRARLWGSAVAGLSLMTAAFYVMPPKWRTTLPAGVCVVELALVVHGASAGLSFRF